MLNRWVLSRDRKTATEGAKVTWSGRLFQTHAAATRKARSPTVRSRVWLTINDEDELERSHWRALPSATWQCSSVRYAGSYHLVIRIHWAGMYRHCALPYQEIHLLACWKLPVLYTGSLCGFTFSHDWGGKHFSPKLQGSHIVSWSPWMCQLQW